MTLFESAYMLDFHEPMEVVGDTVTNPPSKIEAALLEPEPLQLNSLTRKLNEWRPPVSRGHDECT